MALTRAKYKRVTDLYVEGLAHELKDGTVLWLQVLNPFELDEARRDAQVARSRLVLALKGGHGSDERDRVEGWFWGDGREQAISKLIDIGVSNKMMETLLELRDDPEWAEKFTIMDRSDDLMAKPAEDMERKLLEEINLEYINTIAERQDTERSFLELKYRDYTDEQLIEAYVDDYVERRGNDVALSEYALTELWYAARVCEAQKLEDGSWVHANCEGHRLTAYETKKDVRDLPEHLLAELRDAMAQLNMTVRDARFSPRQGSSSESSPLPSEAEASTPSTPTATSGAAPGR